MDERVAPGRSDVKACVRNAVQFVLFRGLGRGYDTSRCGRGQGVSDAAANESWHDSYCFHASFAIWIHAYRTLFMGSRVSMFKYSCGFMLSDVRCGFG